MSETARTLDQERALHAWSQAFTAHANDPLADLGDAVSEMEMRVRLAGLGAALQYSDLKNSPRDKPPDASPALLTALEAWLRQRFPDRESGRKMSERLAAGDSDLWAAASSEAMSYLVWLKLMARLHKKVDSAKR